MVGCLRSALGQARPAGAEETQRGVHGEYRRSRRGSGQLETETQHFCVENRQEKVILCCVKTKAKRRAGNSQSFEKVA